MAKTKSGTFVLYNTGEMVLEEGKKCESCKIMIKRGEKARKIVQRRFTDKRRILWHNVAYNHLPFCPIDIERMAKYESKRNSA